MVESVQVRVRDAVSEARATLAGAGVDTPALDAELLLAEALGVSRERLVMDAYSAVSADRLEHFNDLVARRAAREPVAYILARREFRHISLHVDPRVLIPRPETEHLVEVGLMLPAGASVIDVGTGCGAVALALKHERPDLAVAGVDVSPGAVAVARANALALGLDVPFSEGDLLYGCVGDFDAVLANLPYVASGEALAPEIDRYEPPGALFAGPDGLAVIRRLLGMVDGVRLVGLEVGAGQAGPVASLVSEAGFGQIERLRDLAGHERVVTGRR